MKRIVVMSLGLALALPGTAVAQSALAGRPGTEIGGEAGDVSGRMRAALAPPATLLPNDTAPSPGQRPPRSEKAIGPDLAGAIFAPIGVIVGPITEGLHAFDAAIAPITEVMQPITGPYPIEPAVGPDGAPVPPEAAPALAPPAVAAPVQPAPAGRGPRK